MNSKFISDELIEETYLFCYKRLGNSHDAEDVSQDILLEALKALKSGLEIKSFYSWFWGMARNRVNMFFRMKKYHAVRLGQTEAGTDDGGTIEDSLIQGETVSKLNYSISRLSRLHRDVIIMYYLKEMKISEIARELNVSEGTVKGRLYDAKHRIKEEMDQMQDNIGKSSYAPAELDLGGSYAIPDYWNSISDLMTRQIFVTCSREQKTVRQIADEIGVAPVYFEDKLKYLVDNRFLKETSKGKYLTDFIIYPMQANYDIMAELSEIYDPLGKEMTDTLLSIEKKIRSVGFYGSDMPFGTLLWILYVFASERMSYSLKTRFDLEWQDKVPDSNGKNYRVSGTVTFPDERPEYKGRSNQICWSNLQTHFRTSRYSRVEHANLCDCCPFLGNRDRIITEENADLFMRIFDDPYVVLTGYEEETVANLISLDYVHKKDGGLYLSMPVMTYEQRGMLDEMIDNALAPLYDRYYGRVVEAQNRIMLPYVRDDLMEEYVHWSMQAAFFPVNWVLCYGIYSEDPPLDIPEDWSKSSKGICIYIRK